MSGLRPACQKCKMVEKKKGKRKRKKERNKVKQTESQKAKGVQGKYFKQPCYPIYEGQHLTGLVQAVKGCGHCLQVFLC